MTNEELHAHFIYEADTGTLRKIKANRKPYPWSAATGDRGGYFKTAFNHRTYYLHRLIWQYHHGVVPDMIDHADGDVSNNRIENLRECTNQQNQYNRKPNTGSRSGIKGVVFHKNNIRHPWWASITQQGVRISLGYYPTKELAGEAYAKGAALVALQFARTK